MAKVEFKFEPKGSPRVVATGLAWDGLAAQIPAFRPWLPQHRRKEASLCELASCEYHS